MQNGVYDDFGGNVMDFIIVYTNTTSVAYKGMGLGRSIQLTRDDIQAIKQQIPNVRFIASENQINNATITYEKKIGNFAVHGIPDDYFKIKETVPFNFGRKQNPLDMQQVRKICVLGTSVVEKIFGKDANPVSKDIRINGVVMTVVGVFYDKSNNGRDSERVYIPDTTYRKVFGGSENVQNIWLRPLEGTDGFELEKKVVDLLQHRHTVSPEDKRAIRSFNMAEPAKMVKGLFLGINALIWFVGLGTLAAGIVGVSNIMIITVKERTREIGIRKALGATPVNIVTTLLLESILVTGVAGYAGMVLGVGLLELINFILNSLQIKLSFFQRPEINFQVAITAIILLVACGALAGLVPALRAARIMPIEAMRAE
jgi:putative ABC transport system permease protein